MPSANGTFEIVMTPGPAELAGALSRFDFTKTFRGDIEGTGVGVFLSCGDPSSGEAGYVAIETVDGALGGRTGGFALQQFGQLHAGAQTLYYDVVPGSGRDELAGITGNLVLIVEDDGTHYYRLEYELGA